MMKKAVISVVLLFLLFVSIVSAAAETGSCTGFWGTIKCFVFGDAAKRTAIGGMEYE